MRCHTRQATAWVVIIFPFPNISFYDLSFTSEKWKEYRKNSFVYFTRKLEPSSKHSSVLRKEKLTEIIFTMKHLNKCYQCDTKYGTLCAQVLLALGRFLFYFSHYIIKFYNFIVTNMAFYYNNAQIQAVLFTE